MAENKSENSAADMSADSLSGSRILVVYFSMAGEQYGVGVISRGNTAVVAEIIAEKLNADSFEITPVNEKYSSCSYQRLTEIANQEFEEKSRPEFREDVPDLSRYDTVFIGAPVWWGDWPMICYSFFEKYGNAMVGKKLFPFCTHAGSGLSDFDRKLRKAVPECNVGKGCSFIGTDAQKNPGNIKTAVEKWLAEIGIVPNNH